MLPKRFGVLGLLVALARFAAAEVSTEQKASAPLDLGGLGGMGGGNRKDPITVTANGLEFDYKQNVVTYRGNVLAVQGDVKVKSDTLIIVLSGKPAAAGPDKTKEKAGSSEAAAGASAAPGQKVSLQMITALGNVRIDQADRWATGGKAVFDQTARTFVLSEKPVLHEGQNQVSGERIVVYLDQNRSVVEGGPAKRVQAVLYPDKGGGLAPEAPKR